MVLSLLDSFSLSILPSIQVTAMVRRHGTLQTSNPTFTLVEKKARKITKPHLLMENSQEHLLASPKTWVHAVGFLFVKPMEEPPHLPSYFSRVFQKYITFPSSCLSNCNEIGQLFRRWQEQPDRQTRTHLAFTQPLFLLLKKPIKEKQPTNTIHTPPCFQPAWGCQEQQPQAATPGQSLRAQISPPEV